MVKYALLLLMLICASNAVAQNIPGIKFDYDAVGNRIKRYPNLIVSPPSKANTRIEDTTKIESKELWSISVFPNPTQGMIRITAIGLPIDSVSTYFIINNLGSKIKDGVLLIDTSEDFTLLPAGIYHLTTAVGKDIKKWKIIKE